MNPIADIKSDLHPQKQMVTRGEMQAIIAGGLHLVQRKYDGEFSTLQIGEATILAEFMRGEISGHLYTAGDREMFRLCPGGWFAALTVALWHGKNVLGMDAEDRQSLLRLASKDFTKDIILAEPVFDVESCIASGAEGVVAHAWGSAWGNMMCVKQAQIHLCRVTGHCGGTQSVFISDAATGQQRGKITLRGGKCDQVKIGSIIRVESMGETDSGKLRQPNPCREWLVTY